MHVAAHITLHPVVHISKHEMDFSRLFGVEKIGKRRISRMHALKHHVSSCFRESFCRSNLIKIEHLLSDFVPLFINFFMDIYLKFFQTYQDACRMPNAHLRVRT